MSNFSETEFQFGKRISDYVLDNSMYINKNECNDYTPPFITYIPGGVPNIDAESELKCMNRKIYNNPNPSLAQGILNGVFDPSVRKSLGLKKNVKQRYVVRRRLIQD